MSVEINRITPLIYEEEHVVEHLQRIEEYFEELQDNLSEVRDYMVALLEWVIENQDTNVKSMIAQLDKIIFLLREICPPDEIIIMPDMMTPGMMPVKSIEQLQDDGEPMLSPIVLAKSERPSEQE